MNKNSLAMGIVALIERFEHETGLSIEKVEVLDDRGGAGVFDVTIVASNEDVHEIYVTVGH